MTEQESLEQRAAYGLPHQQPCNCISCSTTRKALAAGEAERQRLEEAATDWRLAQYETARQRQRLQERMREMKVLLGDAISLLTEFASGYLSPDGKTVIEERGSMGHDLSELWRKVVLLEQGEEKP